MKRTEVFMTKLAEQDAEWIDEQAVVFGSRSLVLNICVRIIRACIAAQILRWELQEIKALLQGNYCNQVSLASGKTGRAEDRQVARASRLLYTASRSRAATEAVKASPITPFNVFGTTLAGSVCQ